MKNCDEMVSSLLERRDQYVAGQKRKKALMTRTASAALCVCLVTLLGFGMWRSGARPATPPDQPANTPAANNKIVINSIDPSSADRAKMNICLHGEDFVEMTHDEMAAYCGVDYLPEVPEDLNAWKDERHGIFRRDGGTGEVYWDADILNYSNADYTRNVCLEVKKGGNVHFVCCYFDGTEETSLINNVEVLLGQTDYGYYYAEFTYRDVGFILHTSGLTQDEFVAILVSLTD